MPLRMGAGMQKFLRPREARLPSTVQILPAASGRCCRKQLSGLAQAILQLAWAAGKTECVRQFRRIQQKFVDRTRAILDQLAGPEPFEQPARRIADRRRLAGTHIEDTRCTAQCDLAQGPAKEADWNKIAAR